MFKKYPTYNFKFANDTIEGKCDFFDLYNSIHCEYTLLFNTMRITDNYLSFSVVKNGTNIYDLDWKELYLEPIFYDINIPKNNLNDLVNILLNRISGEQKYYLSHDNRSELTYDLRTKAVFEIIDNGNNEINLSFYTPYKTTYKISLTEKPYTYYYSILQFYISDIDSLSDLKSEFKTSHNIYICRLQNKISDEVVFPRFVHKEEYENLFVERLINVLERNYLKYNNSKPFDIKQIKPKGYFPRWCAKMFSMFHDYPSYPKPKKEIDF